MNHYFKDLFLSEEKAKKELCAAISAHDESLEAIYENLINMPAEHSDAFGALFRAAELFITGNLEKKHYVYFTQGLVSTFDVNALLTLTSLAHTGVRQIFINKAQQVNVE